MTREEVKKMLPIMQAYAEGKNIQFLSDGEWHDINQSDFTCYPDKYRIKPEPKYRPFKNKEECWNEMMEHQPSGWVVDKFYNFCHIGSVYSGKKETYGVRFYKDDANYDYEYMLKEYKFADGAPFGIKDEKL